MKKFQKMLLLSTKVTLVMKELIMLISFFLELLILKNLHCSLTLTEDHNKAEELRPLLALQEKIG